MSLAYVAFGGNLGNPASAYDAVGDVFRRDQRITHVRVSPLFRTQPVGGPVGQAPFLNGVLEVETSLGPESFLALLLDTEQALGRVRQQRWDARTVDLDILLFDQQVWDTPTLAIPHPRFHYRRFVLDPLSAINPRARHPLLGLSAGELQQRLAAPDTVFLLLTPSPRQAEKTREDLREPRPEFARRCLITDCPSPRFSVIMGPECSAVGARWADQPTADLFPANAWGLLLDEPSNRDEYHSAWQTGANIGANIGLESEIGQQTSVAAPNVILPVVDCRADTATTTLQHLCLFADAIIAPRIAEPSANPRD